MTDREVERGVWGACGCGAWRYRLRDPGYVPEGGDNPGWERGGTGKDDGEYFVDAPDRGFHCSGSDCGDFCGEGGHVKPNLRQEVAQLREVLDAVHEGCEEEELERECLTPLADELADFEGWRISIIVKGAKALQAMRDILRGEVASQMPDGKGADSDGVP